MVAGPPPNLAILAWTAPVAIIMLVGAGMVSTCWRGLSRIFWDRCLLSFEICKLKNCPSLGKNLMSPKEMREAWFGIGFRVVWSQPSPNLRSSGMHFIFARSSLQCILFLIQL